MFVSCKFTSSSSIRMHSKALSGESSKKFLSKKISSTVSASSSAAVGSSKTIDKRSDEVDEVDDNRFDVWKLLKIFKI